MGKRRLFVLLFAFMTVLLIWTFRLFWMQAPLPFIAQNRWMKASVQQREQSFVLDSGRGHFYDRCQRPMTGNVQHVLVVFPHESEGAAYEELLQLLQIEPASWERFVSALTKPAAWRPPNASEPLLLTEEQAEAVRAMNIPGVLAVPHQMRYFKPQPAAHVIGMMGENAAYVRMKYADLLEKGMISEHQKIGVYGLEKTFDAALRSRGALRLSRYVSAANDKEVLEGIGFRLHIPDHRLYPLKVMTTLDLDLQREIERLLDEANVQAGAVVVLDAENADILAMASRPSFRAADPSTWANKALKAAVPGSIFKAVTAAAALEKGAVHPSELFYCGGDFGKYQFKCWNRSGHGWISFREAFALSCNIAFAQVMQRLSAADAEQMAERLGLLEPIGWRKSGKHPFVQLDAEEAGMVFANDVHRMDEGARLQTAIGQRDAALTPLHAANLVVTILNGGKVMRPRIVSEIRFRDGSVKQRFHRQTLPKRAFSARTAAQLRLWMQDTVAYGTGVSLKSIGAGKHRAAGKSGTAQASINGRPGINQWFIGYGPVDHPRYAVSVLVQGERFGAHQATKLFGQIMEWLFQHSDHA